MSVKKGSGGGSTEHSDLWSIERRTFARRKLFGLLAGAVGLLTISLLASVLIPPASASLPVTIYVDQRIGNNANDGRTPETAFATLNGAIRKAPPTSRIILMGYGDRLIYAGTETRCVTLIGTKEKPFTIQRNTYTNRQNPAEITATRPVPGPWKLVADRSGVRTWAADWPPRIRLEGDPDPGFIKLGGILLVGYPEEPPAAATAGSWWADGKLYIRHDHYDPNEFKIFVKNGDGICVSGKSRHVLIDNLLIDGAVHAVRVEPGAEDVRVSHLVRKNALDDDFRGDER